MLVDDAQVAAQQVADVAAQFDGYVESSSVGGSAPNEFSDDSMSERDAAWVSIRVPAESLTEVMDAVTATGKLVRSSTSQQDVTTITIDLRARIEAAQASVDRLTSLVAESESVADLIAAESALAERQGQLESYQQELKFYDQQVAMSTVSVQLSENPSPASAEPAGFIDGVRAGWNGLVVALNAVVIALGFILPWLAIAAAVALVIWLIRRRTRNRATNIPAE